MFTESMIRLFAIVLERDGEKVTEALLSSGVMQFISITALDASAEAFRPNTASSSENRNRLIEVRKRIESFLESIAVVPQIPPSVDVTQLARCNLDTENKRLDALATELQQIRDRQRILQSDILKYEEIRRQLSLYGSDFSPNTLKANYSYITIRLGSLPSGNEIALQNLLGATPAVCVPLGEENGRKHIIVISMKRDQEQITAFLDQCGWTTVELASDFRNVNRNMSGAIEERLEKLHGEQLQLQQQATSVITEQSDSLIDTWVQIRVEEMRLQIQSNFKHSSHALLFSGWLPSAQQAKVNESLQRATDGRCYIEWFSPDRVSDIHEENTIPPVKFRNPRVLAPFQMLVANFGVPEYGTIDPTPFLVVTYLTMFGLMFADIGQGTIVALLGLFGTQFYKKKPALRNLSSLLIWCGGSSILFGALFGSVFGFSLVKPLWFDFHGIVTGHAHSSSTISSIFDILGITIKFGIAVISCGLLFNWINLVIKKQWIDFIFDKGGILGGWMYFGGIYCAWYMIVHNYQELPNRTLLLALAALPALLLFLKGPLHARKHREPFSAMALLNFCMEWIVELLEVFSGYLSNTLSFMRVAGLGIAHVSLMVSFFTMAKMVRGDNPDTLASVMSILLLVAGNIMVIALEGLSAGIQALRLNYYEFFTKFFHGTGKLYQPVTLKETHYV